MISLRVLKLCGDSVLPPSELISKSCLESGVCPSEWKVLVHKKVDKQSLKSYPSISLSSICGKMFEQLTYSKIFGYFIASDLISHNQSELKP